MKNKHFKVGRYKNALLLLGSIFILSSESYRSTYADQEIISENIEDYRLNLRYFNDIKRLEKEGFLIQNPTREQLLQAIDNNPNITNDYNMREYFYNYINTLCTKFPELDKSILLKNIEMLQIRYLDKEEIFNETNSSSVQAFYVPFKHTLSFNYENEEDIFEGCVYHESGHIVKMLFFSTTASDMIFTSFSYDGYGISVEEELNSHFTNSVLHNTTSYVYENVDLLNLLIDQEKLYELYFYGNIFDLEKELQKIDSSISSNQFIEYHDLQNTYYFDDIKDNDYDADVDLYKMYIDYFMCKKEHDDYHNFQEESLKFKDILTKVTSKEHCNDILSYFDNKVQKVLKK